MQSSCPIVLCAQHGSNERTRRTATTQLWRARLRYLRAQISLSALSLRNAQMNQNCDCAWSDPHRWSLAREAFSRPNGTFRYSEAATVYVIHEERSVSKSYREGTHHTLTDAAVTNEDDRSMPRSVTIKATKYGGIDKAIKSNKTIIQCTSRKSTSSF